MNLNFGLIEMHERRLSKTRKILLICALIIMICAAILSSRVDHGHFIFILLLLMNFVLLVFAPAFIKRYNLIGDITIGTDKVAIDGDTKLSCKMVDIENIEICYRGFKGESFPNSGIGIGILGFKDGAGNRISFKHNGKEHLYFFLSSKVTDRKGLNILKKTLVESGTSIQINDEED